MSTHRTVARIVGVLSSVTLTLLIVGSQFGLAHHYTSNADAQIAMQQSVLVTQAASAPAARRAMS